MENVHLGTHEQIMLDTYGVKATCMNTTINGVQQDVYCIRGVGSCFATRGLQGIVMVFVVFVIDNDGKT